MIGIGGDEVVHGIIYLMHAGATYQDVMRPSLRRGADPDHAEAARAAAVA
jgi:hypothetical protein